MEDNFKKIENWLRENAEKIIEFSLQESATINEISNLERVIGKNLPDDFKNLYFWHNGLDDDENFGSLFYGMDFFPIDRIIAEYHSKKENYSYETIPLNKTDTEINPSNIYNMDWVKFAFDGSHTSLYLDLAPTNKGNYGQIIFIDDECSTGILVANSTAQLVENFRNDLENNLYHLDEDALEDENHYLTTDPKIDIINWETSEEWKR
jgi:cell wall assembly regulator SMI1